MGQDLLEVLAGVEAADDGVAASLDLGEHGVGASDVASGAAVGHTEVPVQAACGALEHPIHLRDRLDAAYRYMAWAADAVGALDVAGVPGAEAYDEAEGPGVVAYGVEGRHEARVVRVEVHAFGDEGLPVLASSFGDHSAPARWVHHHRTLLGEVPVDHQDVRVVLSFQGLDLAALTSSWIDSQID